MTTIWHVDDDQEMLNAMDLIMILCLNFAFTILSMKDLWVEAVINTTQLKDNSVELEMSSKKS